VPPVLHEADELAPNENELAPEVLEAKVDNFFLIFGLPQLGQFTSAMALELRNSSSKGWLQSEHTNSNKGMIISCSPDWLYQVKYFSISMIRRDPPQKVTHQQFFENRTEPQQQPRSVFNFLRRSICQSRGNCQVILIFQGLALAFDVHYGRYEEGGCA